MSKIKDGNNNTFFESLKKVEEVIAYEKGKLDLRSELFEIPEPPAKAKPNICKRESGKELNIADRTHF